MNPTSPSSLIALGHERSTAFSSLPFLPPCLLYLLHACSMHTHAPDTHCHSACRGGVHILTPCCATVESCSNIISGPSFPSPLPAPDARPPPSPCTHRRLTPNFKIRAEVGFNTRCSFPLTLKVYVITQQEKDSVPEWVPDDFLDPELPQVCRG